MPVQFALLPHTQKRGGTCRAFHGPQNTISAPSRLSLPPLPFSRWSFLLSPSVVFSTLFFFLSFLLSFSFAWGGPDNNWAHAHWTILALYWVEDIVLRNNGHLGYNNKVFFLVYVFVLGVLFRACKRVGLLMQYL